jgi:hypothetical protein
MHICNIVKYVMNNNKGNVHVGIQLNLNIYLETCLLVLC